MLINKRICIVLSNSHPPDFESYNVQEVGLAKALARLGWGVDILVFSKKFGSSVKLISSHEWGRVFAYSGWSLPGQQAISLGVLNWLQRRIRDYAILQVHDCTQILAVAAACVAKRNGTPCLLYQGMYRDHAGLIKAVIHRLYNYFFLPKLFDAIDFAVAKTKVALTYLNEKGLPTRVGSCVIPVGLDVSVFVENNDADKDIDVLYVGKLEERRGLTFLISLIKRLCAANPSIRICVIGQGDGQFVFRKDLSLEIESGAVEYHAKVANRDVGKFYARSKVFLFPTSYEIFGMAVLEAMNFGACVISNAEAGPAEMIEDGVSGFLFSTADTDTWLALIRRLIEDDELANRIRLAAKAKVSSRDGWRISSEEFSDVYDSIKKIR